MTKLADGRSRKGLSWVLTTSPTGDMCIAFITETKDRGGWTTGGIPVNEVEALRRIYEEMVDNGNTEFRDPLEAMDAALAAAKEIDNARIG